MSISRRACLGGMVTAIAHCASLAHAQPIQQIGRDSPEREAILDVARVPVEQSLGIGVIFVVRRLALHGNWVFADLAPRTADGGRIDYRRTRFARDYHPDLDSDTVHVLLRRDVAGWLIVEQAFLPTDVAWDEWRQKHRLPRSLFVDG